jgi:predicted RNase H-like nuclease
MNGKTAKEIIAIYNHPKMKSFRGKMDKLKSHELMDLTIRLPKILGIKVESVNENMKDVMKNAIHQVKTFDKPSNAKLMTIKVINKLKEKRNSSKSTSNKKQLQKMINKVESDYKKGKYLKESVNEGKGVEKILKMADEKSFGKIAGRTVDGMTAGLFKAVYDKAPQNAKDKIDKMNEKQLYVFMGKLWNKFGRQVKLS